MQGTKDFVKRKREGGKGKNQIDMLVTKIGLYGRRKGERGSGALTTRI